MTELVNGLKDALEYTRLYREQIFVLKLGGEVLSSAEALDSIAVQVALLESLSIRVLVVHGGGPQASALSRRMGVEPEIVAGRRVTGPEVLEVAKMVYAGQLNVDVVAALRGHGVPAVGLTGIDGGLVTVRRRPPVEVTDDEGVTRTVDFGHVGDVEGVDTSLLDVLLPRGFVPVVASLAADTGGRVLNVNADTLAEVLASALGAKKLIYLTGAPGLLRDADDPSSLVAFAAPEDLQAMLASGAVRGGMRPKVEACLRAVNGGVRRTHIIDGRTPDALLLELFTGGGSGTMIVGSREKRDYETAGR
ncbi:MAG TPA: acetylglutamate kinase [Candidatus Sulfomarinibacteraceae bacterium]|nr:acetylglutamate kinase [Candidatus Sulfomarinibacteraceae bacterium]